MTNDPTNRNVISENRIFENDGLGIDLQHLVAGSWMGEATVPVGTAPGPDGVTPNDNCDPDGGDDGSSTNNASNDLQNYPELLTALRTGGHTKGHGGSDNDSDGDSDGNSDNDYDNDDNHDSDGDSDGDSDNDDDNGADPSTGSGMTNIQGFLDSVPGRTFLQSMIATRRTRGSSLRN